MFEYHRSTVEARKPFLKCHNFCSSDRLICNARGRRNSTDPMNSKRPAAL